MSGTGIPALSITPNKVAFYYERVPDPLRTYDSSVSRENLKHNKHNGDLSLKASKRVQQTVNWLAYLERKQVKAPVHIKRKQCIKLALITLTLSSSQIHTDREIKTDLLNQFLTELRQTFKVGYYTWKAEKQSNSNLHFHIIIDRSIPWRKVRSTWNRIQNKLGYVDRYAERYSSMSCDEYIHARQEQGVHDITKILQAYKSGMELGFTDPNSIDIHRVREVKDMAAYMAKYMAKSDQDGRIEGRIWGCSQLLSKLRSYNTLECNQFANYLYKVYRSLDLRVILHDFGKVLYLNSRFWESSLCRPLEEILLKYISLQFNPI